MPVMKCTGCHHEWEASRTMIEAPCDWCGEPGLIIKEQTELEAMLAAKWLPAADRAFKIKKKLA